MRRPAWRRRARGFRVDDYGATGRHHCLRQLAARPHHAGGWADPPRPRPGGVQLHRPPQRLPPDPPLELALGADGDATMTEGFWDALLGSPAPAIAVLWLSEPDNTGHASKLGSPAHHRAIASADRCVARVLEAVARRERGGDEILTIVCSDHGMETTSRTVDVTSALVAVGLKAAPDSVDVV